MQSSYQTIGNNKNVNLDTSGFQAGNNNPFQNVVSLKSFSQAIDVGNREMMEQLPSEYIYAEMFKALDLTNKGDISLDDLYMAAKTMGWQKNKVVDLIHDLDPNHEDIVNAQEFMLMMKYIEQKSGEQSLQGNGSL